MKPTKEQVEAYKSMAKQSPMSMESMIKAHLVANCPKFIESKLDGCLKYLTACAREILDSKSGEVADDVCYKICRDYFNAAGGKNLHGTKYHLTKTIPALDESPRGRYTKSSAKVVRPLHQ